MADEYQQSVPLHRLGDDLLNARTVDRAILERASLVRQDRRPDIYSGMERTT